VFIDYKVQITSSFIMTSKEDQLLGLKEDCSSGDSATLLPDEVVRAIVAFLPDAPSLCRCAAVSRAFCHAIMGSDNDDLWKRLANQKWKLCPILEPNRNEDDAAGVSSHYRLEFQRRFTLDASVARHIQNMSSDLKSLELEPQLRSGWHWGAQQDDWISLTELLEGNTFDPTHALDGLQRMAGAQSTRAEGGEMVLPKQFEACLASQILDQFYFSHVFVQWKRLMENQRTKRPELLLREGAVLLARFYICFGTLRRTTDLDFFDKAVEDSLSMYADMFSQQLESEYGGGACTCTAVQATQCLLKTLYLAGWYFGNSFDYYNLANTSVNEVLSKRCGIPLTLVLILRWILQKVNVEASVIGLPGHVLLGVTERTGRVFYFDVFRPTGEPLTAQDCRSFVADVAWEDSFLEPMTPTAILTRMLHNIQNAAQHALSRKLSVRMGLLLERSQLLLNAMTAEQTNDDARHAVAPLTLDPEVFREYRLLH
jgi:Transglutaminase-like superfamily/F-box-like